MITKKAYAKINLLLDVHKKRVDGYHDLKMIMMPIDLHDTLTFEDFNEDLVVSNIPIENNLIDKTIKLMKQKYKIDSFVKVTLDKQIPIGAGLGGGSSDVAQTILGLNELWNLNLEKKELEELALSLGSDTLFCLYNKTAYVFGRGEHLLFVDAPRIEDIYLFPSDIISSTKVVFQNHKIKYRHKKFEKALNLYTNEKYNKFFKTTYNSLTKTTLLCYKELKSTLSTLKKVSKNVLMTGSGSTFYILSFDRHKEKLNDKLIKTGLKYIKTKPKT